MACPIHHESRNAQLHARPEGRGNDALADVNSRNLDDNSDRFRNPASVLRFVGGRSRFGAGHSAGAEFQPGCRRDAGKQTDEPAREPDAEDLGHSGGPGAARTGQLFGG